MKLSRVIQAGEPRTCKVGTMTEEQIMGARKIDDYTFTVPASKGPAYVVRTMRREGLRGVFESCSCPAFANFNNAICKHGLLVERLGHLIPRN